MKKILCCFTALIFATVFACDECDCLDHVIKGIQFTAEKNFEKAVAEFTSAIEKDLPNFLFVHNERALALVQLGDVNQAIEDFTLVIDHSKEGSSERVFALYQRAEAYAAVNQLDASIKDLEMAENEDPKLPKYLSTKKYQIVKNAQQILEDKKSRDFFVSVLAHSGFKKEDIIFSNSDVILIKQHPKMIAKAVDFDEEAGCGCKRRRR